MYLNYWRLSYLPFENVPNSNLFFPSPQHEEALSRLLFAVHQGKGVAMLTGDVGCGKTTVSRIFARQLANDGYLVRFIVNPALNPLDFLQAVVLSLDTQAGTTSTKVVLLSRLESLLTTSSTTGGGTVLIIDEAHVIDNPATFDEVRMLLNLQAEDRFLLKIVLIGQPPLREKIAALKPLKERIGVHYQINTLSFDNMVRYILFRLKNAGADHGIFTRKSVETVFEYSQGLPLRTNSVCDRSLLVGMMRRARVVDSAIVKEAIEDLI